MPKSINLGNGKTLIGLDNFGQIKDLYYHYPGLENHVGENLVHKIGVYVDNKLSWIDDGSWIVKVGSLPETMASHITARNETIGLELEFVDVLYNEKNIFIRKIIVKNSFNYARSLKVFFNQQFDISETHIGDTAYYDPREEVLIHYKGRRVFLINALTSEVRGFSNYSIGLNGIEGQTGTYIDALDGELSGNPIEHGSVDSLVQVNIDLEEKGHKAIYYWLTIGKSIETVKKLNEEILARHPEEIIKSTTLYWQAWANVQDFSFYGLSKEVVELFKKSLFYIRAHTAQNGAIIASGDSEMLQFGRDYYRYVWPRDASYAAIALTKAGDFSASKRFFEFARDVITREGYFMHKYRPDKSLGSSWHPWVREGKKQFPIQEDETAIVIWSLWKYYEASRDIEFIESVFNSLIRKAADFMCLYLDEKTGLPRGSYDLWEQAYGISTFTASSVYGALSKSSQFAYLLGKKELGEKYLVKSEEIKKGIVKYLYDKEGYFYKLIDTTSPVPKTNKTIDASSVYGIFEFEVLSESDVKLKKSIDKTLERLVVNTSVGGVARYEGDAYHHKGGNYPGNPWVITTMWIAQYFVKSGRSEKDLDKTKDLLNWVFEHSSFAGTLPEQFDPYSGFHLSASPLVWSHAEFVITVINYLEKLEKLGVAKVRNS